MPHENDKDLRTLCKKAADKIADSFRVGFVDERMVEIFTKDIYDTFKGQVMLAKVQQESQPAPNTPAHHQRIWIEEVSEMLRSLLSLYFKEARCDNAEGGMLLISSREDAVNLFKALQYAIDNNWFGEEKGKR